MALFKILKGDSSRIDISTTPFHDGYAYFTPDDGGFYIDSEDNGQQKRIRINPETVVSTTASANLSASGWSSKKQTLSISGITANSNGVIGVAQNITEAAMEAAKSAGLRVSAQGSGTITIEASGDTPSCDIPVVVVILG